MTCYCSTEEHVLLTLEQRRLGLWLGLDPCFACH